MRRTQWLIAAAAALAVGLVIGRQINAAAPKERSPAAKGKPAPAFTGETVDGKKIALADYKGKSAVLLNFFASW